MITPDPDKPSLNSMAGLYTFLLTVLVLVAMVTLAVMDRPVEVLEFAFIALVGVVAGVTVPSIPRR